MSDGRCLVNAYRELIKRDENGEKVVYVQGNVTNLGKRFQHTWLETKTDVIDPTINLIAPKARYYEKLIPRNVIRIPPEVVAVLVFKYGHKFYTDKEIVPIIEALKSSTTKRKKK
jgi:hypothetical protein